VRASPTRRASNGLGGTRAVSGVDGRVDASAIATARWEVGLSHEPDRAYAAGGSVALSGRAVGVA